MVQQTSTKRKPGRPKGSGPTPASWRPGQSGNPAGAPVTERTRIANRLIQAADEHRDALAAVVVQQALNGCTASQRLLFERLGPAPIRAQTAPGTLAGIATGTIEQRLEAVLAAVSRGDISSDEGKTLADTIRGAIEAVAIAAAERDLQEIRQMRVQIIGGAQTRQNALQEPQMVWEMSDDV